MTKAFLLLVSAVALLIPRPQLAASAAVAAAKDADSNTGGGGGGSDRGKKRAKKGKKGKKDSTKISLAEVEGLKKMAMAKEAPPLDVEGVHAIVAEAGLKVQVTEEWVNSLSSAPLEWNFLVVRPGTAALSRLPRTPPIPMTHDKPNPYLKGL